MPTALGRSGPLAVTFAERYCVHAMGDGCSAADVMDLRLLAWDLSDSICACAKPLGLGHRLQLAAEMLLVTAAGPVPQDDEALFMVAVDIATALVWTLVTHELVTADDGLEALAAFRSAPDIDLACAAELRRRPSVLH